MIKINLPWDKVKTAKVVLWIIGILVNLALLLGLGMAWVYFVIIIGTLVGLSSCTIWAISTLVDESDRKKREARLKAEQDRLEQIRRSYR